MFARMLIFLKTVANKTFFALAVSAGAHLIDDGRFQIDEDRAGDVLAGARLGEERVEGVITAADGLFQIKIQVQISI